MLRCASSKAQRDTVVNNRSVHNYINFNLCMVLANHHIYINRRLPPYRRSAMEKQVTSTPHTWKWEGSGYLTTRRQGTSNQCRYGEYLRTRKKCNSIPKVPITTRVFSPVIRLNVSVVFRQKVRTQTRLLI